jgi:tetratricopeptide (TPR) repeat protein
MRNNVLYGALGGVIVVSVLLACGGDDKKKDLKYPENTAGADGGPAPTGQPVTDNKGAEVAVTDVKSGLSGPAKEAYERGFKAWLEGDIAGAKKGFNEAASLDPKSPMPHYSLGVVLERTGDVAGAQQEYRAAFSAVPEHDLSIAAYALSLANSGHAGEAETFLNDKKSKLPNSPRVLTALAEVKSQQKDHGTAQTLAQDALRLNPDFKEAMVTVARDHYRARKMDLARYALKAILDGFGDQQPPRDKDNAEAHLIRGLIEREAGQRAAAMADFEAAFARRPDMVEVLTQLGSMRLEAGNASDAQPLLEKALKYSDKNALAHLNLGDCYRLAGRVTDAKKELDTALAQDGTLAQAHYNLGLLYLFSPSVPGTNANEQVSTAIKELETYKTMRGPKPPPGTSDDIDDLLNKAKAKQNELKNAAAASGGAAPAASGSAKPK